jgi:hypothetical protein
VEDVGPTLWPVTVLAAQAVLADARRWWTDTGRDRGLDKSQVYDLLETAAREVDAAWGALTPQLDGSRAYTSRPDDPSLPAVTLQVFDIVHSSDLVQPDDLTSFLVVWAIKLWFY